MVMTIKTLREQIKDLPDDTEVFIRRVNSYGNPVIDRAGAVIIDTHGFHHNEKQCVVIEQWLDFDND